MRKTTAAAVMVVLAATVTACGASATAGTAQRSRPGLVTEGQLHQTSFSLIDLGDKGASQGDEIAFTDDVYDRAGSRRGVDGGLCVETVTAAPAQYTCQVVLRFANGQVTAAWLATLDELATVGRQYTAAISGGTGAYRGLHGEVALLNRPDQRADFSVRLG